MRVYIKKWLMVFILLLSLAVILSGCGKKDPLLGTWKEPDSGVVMEITEDGEVIMSLNDASITLQYTREDPNVIIFLASADGSIPEQRMTYKINEDKLVLTLDGVKTVFRRVVD